MINTRMCPNPDSFKLISTSVSTGPCVARSQNKPVNRLNERSERSLGIKDTTDMSSAETVF